MKFARRMKNDLKRRLRMAAIDQLEARQKYVGTKSNPERLREALTLLRPIKTEYPLLRIGADRDGGYLVPDDLDGIKACFSPGVAQVSAFEEQIAGTYQIPSYLADGSVPAAPVEHPLLDFEGRFVGSKDDPLFMDPEAWIAAKLGDDTTSDLLLQIDIEGGEFDVMTFLSDAALRRFRIIVIELHDLDALFHATTLNFYTSFLRKLTRHHHVVHLHPNNQVEPRRLMGLEIPPVLEVTLIRKDRVSQIEPATLFPHPLDQDNNPRKPHLALPRVFYA